MKNRTITIVLGTILGALLLSSCGLADAQTNERCVVYTGGVIEDRDFAGFVEPGRNAESIGMGSESYCYRTDQRSYIGNNDNTGADGPSIEVVSKDDMSLFVEYQLYFKLNLDDEIFRKFHDNLGVKTEAWTTDGWRQMLNEYFRPQIERAAEASALNYDWRELYASEETRQAFNSDTARRVKENIRAVIGDDYFCGPNYNGAGTDCGDFTFTIGKPKPTNGDVIKGIESEQTKILETNAQAQENLRVESQLESERALVELYGPDGALLRKAIENGQVKIMVVPSDGSVVVPTPDPNQP